MLGLAHINIPIFLDIHLKTILENVWLVDLLERYESGWDVSMLLPTGKTYYYLESNRG